MLGRGARCRGAISAARRRSANARVCSVYTVLRTVALHAQRAATHVHATQIARALNTLASPRLLQIYIFHFSHMPSWSARTRCAEPRRGFELLNEDARRLATPDSRESSVSRAPDTASGARRVTRDARALRGRAARAAHKAGAGSRAVSVHTLHLAHISMILDPTRRSPPQHRAPAHGSGTHTATRQSRARARDMMTNSIYINGLQ